MVDLFMTWLQDFRYSRSVISWTPMDATMGFPYPIRIKGQPYLIVPFYRTSEAGEGLLFHSSMMVSYPKMKVVGYLSCEIFGDKVHKVASEKHLEAPSIDAYFHQLANWVASEGGGLDNLQNQFMTVLDEGRRMLYTALKHAFLKEEEVF